MTKKIVVFAALFLFCFGAAFCLQPNVFSSNFFVSESTQVECVDNQSSVNSALSNSSNISNPSNLSNFSSTSNAGEQLNNSASAAALEQENVRVDFSFQNHSLVVDGGVFQVQDKNILTSGNGFSVVSAYAPAGETFTVKAFVKKGYYLNFSKVFAQENLNNPFWSVTNINSFATSFENTGFVLGVSFDVTVFQNSAQNNIQILLQSTKYTVAFMDGTTTVATVKNVEFNSSIDISESNQENITLFSTSFENGKVDLAKSIDKQTFVGYFAEINGGGRQYVFWDGNTQQVQQFGQEQPTYLPNPFLETGYVLNPATAKYQLSRNARLLADGSVQISLYAYRRTSYTRVVFDINQQLSSNFVAQDFVQGAQTNDLWFSTDSPMEILIAFGTNATFCAPDIDGYRFFRFIVKRQLASQVSTGAWMPDAYSYSQQLPWFANETEDYVNCLVTIEYFAKVGVVVLNGEANYTLSQNFDGEMGRAEAMNLLEQGFVDTKRPLSVLALPKSGYTFSYWQNVQNGQTWTTENIVALNVSKPTQLRLILQGDPVILDFSKYDFQHGKIMNVILSTDVGVVARHQIGSYSNGEFVSQPQVVANFGQKATLQLQIDQDYAIQWPEQEYMTYEGYQNGLHNFSFTLFVPQQQESIIIAPEFEYLKISYYLNPIISETVWQAMDENKGFSAVDVVYSGREIKSLFTDKDAPIELEILAHPRYKIQKIEIKDSGQIYNAEEYHLFEDNKLVLSKQFLFSYHLEGLVEIEIVLARLKWEEGSFDSAEFFGAGAEEEPYIISTAQELAKMMILCNSGRENAYGIKYRYCAYKLSENISMANQFWTLVGNERHPFAGSFDFNGHTISGVFTVQNQQANYGIFGVMRSSAKITMNTRSPFLITLVVLAFVVLLGLLIAIAVIAGKHKAIRKHLSLK